MLVQDFAALGKLIQEPIEHDYGLKSQFNFSNHYRYCPKMYRPLCESLGVGLFGGELVLLSPTGKPVGSFTVTWSFETGGKDKGEQEDFSVSSYKDQWCPWEGRGAPDDFKDRPPLTAETQVRRVKLDVNYSGVWNQEMGQGCTVDDVPYVPHLVYLTDLRCLLREKLKKTFPEVAINLTNNR